MRVVFDEASTRFDHWLNAYYMVFPPMSDKYGEFTTNYHLSIWATQGVKALGVTTWSENRRFIMTINSKTGIVTETADES